MHVIEGIHKEVEKGIGPLGASPTETKGAGSEEGI